MGLNPSVHIDQMWYRASVVLTCCGEMEAGDAQDSRKQATLAFPSSSLSETLPQ